MIITKNFIEDTKSFKKFKSQSQDTDFCKLRSFYMTTTHRIIKSFVYLTNIRSQLTNFLIPSNKICQNVAVFRALLTTGHFFFAELMFYRSRRNFLHLAIIPSQLANQLAMAKGKSQARLS